MSKTSRAGRPDDLDEVKVHQHGEAPPEVIHFLACLQTERVPVAHHERAANLVASIVSDAALQTLIVVEEALGIGAMLLQVLLNN